MMLPTINVRRVCEMPCRLPTSVTRGCGLRDLVDIVLHRSAVQSEGSTRWHCHLIPHQPVIDWYIHYVSDNTGELKFCNEEDTQW